MKQERKGVALITGAARRIGAAIATSLAAQGWAVAIHANNSIEEAEALARRIRGDGGTAEVLNADLRRTEVLSDLVRCATDTLGPLGLLVNNASVFERDEIGTLNAATFDDHYAVHVRAPCFLAEAFAAELDKSESGLVVNIIDQRVLKPTPNFFSYQISKSAMWAATLAMAQALAPRCRVNAIGPGPTLASARQEQADFEAQCAALPLGQGPSLDDFGRAIHFLLETPSITGQMIALDGGQHIAWQTPDVTEIDE